MIEIQEDKNKLDVSFPPQIIDEEWKKYNKRMDDMIDDAEIEAELEAENKIRSNYEVGEIKVRITGKVNQLIWKRVGFLEFDKQWRSPMNQNSIASKVDLKFLPKSPVSKKREIYSEGRGFLYCRYKCIEDKNQGKLILLEKHPILITPRRSRKKIIKALNMLSKILGHSKELKDIALLLNLSWQAGIKI